MALKVFIAWNTVGGSDLPTEKAKNNLKAKLTGSAFTVKTKKCDASHGSEYFNDPVGASQEQADKHTIAVYFGHGAKESIALRPTDSSTLAWQWGDGTLRHALLVACSVFENFDASHWTSVFAGVRTVMGFSKDYSFGEDPGGDLGKALLESPSLVDAWFHFAPSVNGPCVLLADESCLSDTLASTGAAITVATPSFLFQTSPPPAVVSSSASLPIFRVAAPGRQLELRSAAMSALGAAEASGTWKADRVSPGAYSVEWSRRLPMAEALQIARTTPSIDELDDGSARAIFDALEEAVSPAVPLGPFVKPFPLWPSATRLRQGASETTILLHGDLERSAEGVPFAGSGTTARVTFARDRSITRLGFVGRALDLVERRPKVISRDDARQIVADKLSLDRDWIRDWRSGPPLALWLAAPQRAMEFVIPFHAFEVSTTADGARTVMLTPAIELAPSEHRWVDPLRPQTTIILP